MKEKFKVLLSDLWTAIRWGIILSLLMMGVLWLSDRLQIFDSMPSSESLIITFIGILATFVVVSNFSQVANIEEKADRKIKEIEKKVNIISKQCLDKKDTTSLAYSVAQTKDMIEMIKGKDDLKSLGTVKDEAKNEMKVELKDDIKRYERVNLEEIDLRSFQMLKFANALINSKQKDILQKFLLDTNALFKITYIKNGKNKTNNARIQLKDETIQFISETGKTTYDNVFKIDGIRYDSEEIDMALCFILKAIKKTGIYDRTNLSGNVLDNDQI